MNLYFVSFYKQVLKSTGISNINRNELNFKSYRAFYFFTDFLPFYLGITKFTLLLCTSVIAVFQFLTFAFNGQKCLQYIVLFPASFFSYFRQQQSLKNILKQRRVILHACFLTDILEYTYLTNISILYYEALWRWTFTSTLATIKWVESHLRESDAFS